MIIDFRKAIETELYPVNADIKLNESLLSKFYEAKFGSTPHVEGWYVLTDDNLTVNLIVSVDVIFKCDRCLTETARTFNFKVGEVFVDGSKNKDAEFVYQNDTVDLTNLIEERFLLNLPISVLCKPDCKGLCPKCGTNLNVSKCDCNLNNDEDDVVDKNNPFAKLQNLKINAGGANNGSTKG